MYSNQQVKDDVSCHKVNYIYLEINEPSPLMLILYFQTSALDEIT